ncbi:MAG: Uncharacterized protein XD72_1758 [Methanothrix harundinacea]|uniref:Terminase large subunit gp17-like C-terminal domain-containing protein n=1 Tax=Methanothrix harundinacea TaxID=301375 RepID=A0A117LF71_9EURY|nr:MAG: Uncharacterized protein XD72_1758 [Methanothrix harundinacea]KUK95986.1 MAG: Uncharacterized protein XE07_1422 [Methanothrix harundinacea]
MEYIVGVDLGQARDFTAITVLEEHPGRKFHIRHLDRIRLDYVEVVEHVHALLRREPLQRCTSLVVDATGVGRPVIDLMRSKGLRPVPVTIHGGDVVTKAEDRFWRVPKRDLVASLQVAMETGTLQIAEELELADVLVKELQNFRVKININSGHDSYEAWREKDHDDLVLAAAVAVWWGKRQPGPPPDPNMLARRGLLIRMI